MRVITVPIATLLAGGVLALSGCAASPAPVATVTVTAAAPVPVLTATPAAATATPTPSTAIAIARGLAARIPTVTGTTKITEDNDPNDLIGRPNGYVGAAVVKDRRVHCSDGLGVNCGATIERWPTAADARSRKAYIQAILEGRPALGSEYDTVRGRFVLRVTGALKPSQAKRYVAVFDDLLGR